MRTPVDMGPGWDPSEDFDWEPDDREPEEEEDEDGWDAEIDFDPDN